MIEVIFSIQWVIIIGVRCGMSVIINGYYGIILQRVIFGRFQGEGLNLKFVYFC